MTSVNEITKQVKNVKRDAHNLVRKIYIYIYVCGVCVCVYIYLYIKEIELYKRERCI